MRDFSLNHRQPFNSAKDELPEEAKEPEALQEEHEPPKELQVPNEPDKPSLRSSKISKFSSLKNDVKFENLV